MWTRTEYVFAEVFLLVGRDYFLFIIGGVGLSP
jgi:hypothetical protein